jgi:hypothetical protein
MRAKYGSSLPLDIELCGVCQQEVFYVVSLVYNSYFGLLSRLLNRTADLLIRSDILPLIVFYCSHRYQICWPHCPVLFSSRYYSFL